MTKGLVLNAVTREHSAYYYGSSYNYHYYGASYSGEESESA